MSEEGKAKLEELYEIIRRRSEANLSYPIYNQPEPLTKTVKEDFVNLDEKFDTRQDYAVRPSKVLGRATRYG